MNRLLHKPTEKKVYALPLNFPLGNRLYFAAITGRVDFFYQDFCFLNLMKRFIQF